MECMVRLALLVSIGMANALSPCASVDQIEMSNLADAKRLMTADASTNPVPKLRCPWAPRRVGSFSLCTLCKTFGILTASFVRHEDLDQNCICDDGWTTAGITDTLHFLQGTDQICRFCEYLRKNPNLLYPSTSATLL